MSSHGQGVACYNDDATQGGGDDYCPEVAAASSFRVVEMIDDGVLLCESLFLYR